jgi:hypothetical protein
MHYRRAQFSDGTYFFTVALAERRNSLLIKQSACRYAKFMFDIHVNVKEESHD